MKSLAAEGKYAEAAEIADTINWNKVKNVNVLVKVGEIYEQEGRYEDSRDILLNAYDHSPIGRTIIYRLAEVAIKMEDFSGAKEYYEEFVDIAPHDNQRYVLKYNIMKAEGAAPGELVSVLEEFKEQEYSEEWAYELAYLYHKTGAVEKCIEACDELILWFGDGPFVERALELKMLYQPLTKSQEDKYRRFRHAREGKTVIDQDVMIRAGEYAHEQVVIPQVTLNQSKFNTVNLQEELAKGMQQIIEATKRETVDGTLDNIKKIVEEIPYLQIPKEEAYNDEKYGHIATDEEIDGSLKINFQEMLREESDGQISMMVNEKTALEKQITGQMTIADALEEWEKTMRAAEAALQEAEQKKLESAKARALQEAEDIMERLTGVLPKIEAGVTPKELLEEEYLQKKDDILDATVETEALAEIKAAFWEEEDLADEEELGFEEEIETEEVEPEIELGIQEQFQDEEDLEDEEELEIEEELGTEDVLEPEGVLVIEGELGIKEGFGIEEGFGTEEELEPEENFEKEFKMDEEILEEEKEISAFISDLLEDQPKATIKKLTEAQRAVFSYFVPVKGMEHQICDALAGITRHLEQNEAATTGNLIIQGGGGCGKTTLATGMIKALQNECGKPNGKVGKIDAGALNKKDIQLLLKKVAGGCLIIEDAGSLDRKTVVALSLLMEQDTSGLLVIMEGSAGEVKKALALDDSFAKKFTEVISVPIFNNDELVMFAKAYAHELGYEIEELAVLALYNRISNIQRLDQATKLEEIKEIVDGAIEKESRSGLRRFFRTLTASRYTDDEQIVLTEKDFE